MAAIDTDAGPGPDSAAETAVKALYDSLSPAQKAEVCFPWDFADARRGLLRTFVSNHWYVTRPFIRSAFYSKPQQDIIHDIFTGLINPEWYDRFLKQMRDDTYGQDWGEEQSVAIFGTPGTGQFQFVMTGRHTTLRADGGSEDRMAFGGPILYGHDPDASYTEKPGHPGNVFWRQSELANGLLDLLDGRQRSRAIVGRLPHEADMGFRVDRDGIAVDELAGDQRDELRKVLDALLDPFRAEDRRRVLACLDAQGGLDACHLAFYREGRLSEDGAWDNWRLEGPAFAWYYRGAPHAHVWVNVADTPAVPFNARIREVVDPMPVPRPTEIRSGASRAPASRIVAISSVKNEIDIIEPFVRHALAHADHLVVGDDGSTDGTLEILRALQHEGLPLTVVEDATAGKYLSQRMTRLMREHAVERHGADWVLPLDADEFLILHNDAPPVPEGSRTDATISLRWRTYVPDETDDPAKRNPVLRIRHRLEEEALAYVKVIVPRALAARPDAVLSRGSHGLFVGGRVCESIDARGACLAHFPVRSPGQYLAKVAISAFQQQTMGVQPSDLAFHLWAPYELLKRDIAAFAASIGDGARRFAVPAGMEFRPSTVLDPLPYRGGPILHTPKVDDRERGWHAVIRYTEALAKRYAILTTGLGPEQRVALEQGINAALGASSADVWTPPPVPVDPGEPTVTPLDHRVRELEAALERTAEEMHRTLQAVRRSWTWRVGSAAVWPASRVRRLARTLRARRARSA